VERVLAAARVAISDLHDAADLILPGTPITFQRFTRRAQGWVGDWPQTSLFRAWSPRLAPDVWMVSDSIFPGQSTAAVALGGLYVADALLRESKLSSPNRINAKAQRSFSLRPRTAES
jgi:hypothetical protein